MQDWADFWTKTFWTAVSAALGAATAPALLNLPISTLEAMGVAAFTVIYNAITIFARQRSEARSERGQSAVVVLLMIIVIIILLYLLVPGFGNGR